MPEANVESILQSLNDANELLAVHAALLLRVRSAQKEHRQQLHALESPPTELLRLPLIPSRSPSPASSEEDSPPSSPVGRLELREDLPPYKRARAARYQNYIPEEETIRNDYSQRYVDGGEWPQNWVLGAEPEHRFEEYPKQQRLLTLKKATVNENSLPPYHLPFSELKSLHPSKFDVILLDPPFSSSFTWDHLQDLNVPSLAGDPSFVFLWVGSGAGEGLERGREVLAKWGYRRCEDVVWVKTNRTTNRGPGTDPPTTSLLVRTKQHCLMGIRGTVRRSTDSWFVHCNVDTDVIVWEGDPLDPTRKPPEMYTLIENFCLGTRRLEVFGKRSSLRRGWVTVLAPNQEELLPTNTTIHVEGEEGGVATRWKQDSWEQGIRELSHGGKPVLPMTQEIDNLRPKSPVRGERNSQGGGGGGGGGNMPNANMGGMNGMNMGMGNMNMGMGMNNAMGGANRFMMGGGGQGRGGNANPAFGMNQMMGVPMGMGQPMFGGMNPGMNQMGMAGMGGMGGMTGMGMGGGGGDMDGMMGNWNPLMAAGGGGMGVSGGVPVGIGMGGGGAMGARTGGTGMGNAGRGGGGGMVNPGMRAGGGAVPIATPMAGNAMGNMPLNMGAPIMGQMGGMGNMNLSGGGHGMGGGGVSSGQPLGGGVGLGVNPAAANANFVGGGSAAGGGGAMPGMFNNGWDQSQFGGMDASWNEEEQMNGGMMGMPVMMPGMGMGNVNGMGGMGGGMGMNQQWGGGGF